MAAAAAAAMAPTRTQRCVFMYDTRWVAAQTKLVDLRSRAGLETRTSNGKTRDSQSMGFMEVKIRWWRGKVRTLRMAAEAAYGKKLTPTYPVWPFLASWAADGNDDVQFAAQV